MGFLGAIHKRQSAVNAISISNVAVAAQGDSTAIKNAVKGYLKQASQPVMKKTASKKKLEKGENK